MVVKKQRSVRTAPRQKLHSTVSMLKCYLHLETSPMAKLATGARVAPIVAEQRAMGVRWQSGVGRSSARYGSEWSVKGASAWVALL